MVFEAMKGIKKYAYLQGAAVFNYRNPGVPYDQFCWLLVFTLALATDVIKCEQ